MGQLFSKKNKEVFSAPLGIDNPVTVQVLGICSALAVTAKLEPARDGTFSNGDYCICQRCYFTVA